MKKFNTAKDLSGASSATLTAGTLEDFNHIDLATSLWAFAKLRRK